MEMKKKLLTEVERMKRGRDNHQILNGCSPQKTVPKLLETRRNQIYKYYWSLTKDNQNIWISHMVETITPVRPRKKTTGKKRFTRIYHLENDKRSKGQGLLENVPKAIGTVLSKVEVPGQMMYLIKGEKLNLQTKKR